MTLFKIYDNIKVTKGEELSSVRIKFQVKSPCVRTFVEDIFFESRLCVRKADFFIFFLKNFEKSIDNFQKSVIIYR